MRRLFSDHARIAFLPLAGAVRRHHLHRRHLVFGAIGRPVGIFGGDDIGLRRGVVEGGIDHARRDPVGHLGAQAWSRRCGWQGAPSRRSLTPRFSASVGWISSTSSSCHTTFSVRRVCAPTLYCDKDAPGGEQQRIARAGLLVGRHIVGDDELAPARGEMIDMHDRAAIRAGFVHRPLQRACLHRAARTRRPRSWA